MTRHSHPGVIDNDIYPTALRDAETALIAMRRIRAAPDAPIDAPSDSSCVGVALSGGGIRSATFCLGVFRALARADLVRHIDFLSTVSGGGYFGAFLGGLFTPRSHEDSTGQPQQQRRSLADQVTDQLLDLHSKPVDWLRENGRYMSPNGGGDTLLMAAVIIRNLIAVHVVIVTALVTLMSGALLLAKWYEALPGAIRAGLSQLEPLLALSPWFAAPVVALAVFVVPLAWAFWFTQPGWPWGPWRTGLTPLSTVIMLLAAVVATRNTGWSMLVGAEALLALCWSLLGRVRAAREYPQQDADAQAETGTRRVERNFLSRWLSNALWTAVALTLFSLVDWVGQSLTIHTPQWVVPALISSSGAILGASGVIQALLSFFAGLEKRKRLPFPTQIAASIVAALALGVVFISVSALAHYVDNWIEWHNSLLWLFVGSAVLAIAFGRTIPFLNLSSHQTLYGARLTRAYVGASNPKRHSGIVTISETIPGDAVSMTEYEPHANGGPLHLINVTLNETVSGKSQIEQRDRKGLGMAIGPAGVSVGRRHHALWTGVRPRGLKAIAPAEERQGDFWIFPVDGKESVFTPDELDLGDWTSVSGAAFSTGLGSRTSLAVSMLMGLANVRLGYWWDSGVDPGIRHVEGRKGGSVKTRSGKVFRMVADALPVYAYLFDELLARFHGAARRRWYLSDGGHSENTGAYELIRRRVPFIVICDDGCDPEYGFEDLGNLVRRVRTDFNAEVAFYSREQLAELLPMDALPYFGLPDDFAARKVRQRYQCCHALLAGVFYDDPDRLKAEPDSVLLILKPTVSGDEPLDVLEYKRAHAAFPHESTIDQYFDEAQWESYRRLGEHIASVVFESSGAGVWAPRKFVKPPAPTSPWPRTRAGATVST